MRDGKFEFTDGPMFSRVMSNESICRRVLEAILGIEIERIVYSHIEHSIEPGLSARGIRADVYVKTDEAVYDIEMQTSGGFAMGKRLRYYQGAMDVGTLKKGQAYDELPQSIIIFICDYDPYLQNAPVYKLNMECLDHPDIRIGHGFSWIVLNATAFARLESGPLHDLLEYVAEGKVSRSRGLTTDINRAVEAANTDEKWRREKMDVYTWEEDIAAKAGYLERKSKKLESKEESLGAQEERLGAKEESLAERAEDLAERESSVAEKEEGLTAREENLAAKEEGLTAKEVNLVTKEENLAAREEGLEAREGSLLDREGDLAEREAAAEAARIRIDKEKAELALLAEELRKRAKELGSKE